MEIHSNAFNFGSFLSGEVDLRTGLYNGVIPLAEIYPQGSLEISRSINLKFSMLNGSNVGYGKGWTISETTFDPAPEYPQLKLMNGERFVARNLPSVGQQVDLLDKKLKDLVVKRVEAFVFHVIYSDGTIEVLRHSAQTNLFMLDQIIFENGERFEFLRSFGGLLLKVVNMQSQEEILSLEYIGSTLSAANNLVHGGRVTRKIFDALHNDELTSVTMPFERDDPPENPPRYTFRYESYENDVVAITRLESPGGGVEEIDYSPKGHQVDHDKFIPYVSVWRRIPGAGQENIIRRYTYSSSNFTGFPINGGFRQGVDNLYFVQTDSFNYSCEEEVVRVVQEGEGGGNIVVLQVKRCEFNNFHLLVEEKVTREDKCITKNITYNNLPGVNFAEQPSNLQLPKKIVTKYEVIDGGESRSEELLIDTDEWGNEISRTEISGIRHETSYYPIEGDADLCPPEPNGQFVRYKKELKVYPAFGEIAPRVSNFTYTAMGGLYGGNFFVLLKSDCFDGGVIQNNYEYWADESSAIHGRLRSKSFTVNGLTTKTEFTYEVRNNLIFEHRRIIGYDETFLVSSRSLSLVGRLLHSVDKEDLTSLVYEYDVMGRLIAETVSPGTDNEAARTYEYSIENGCATLTTVDALGSEFVTRYDGHGRRVSNSLRRNDELFELVKYTYNVFDQVSSEESLDLIDGDKLSLITRYEFNSWGESSRVIRPDGSALIAEYDPVSRTKVEGVDGLRPTITIYNSFNKVDSQTSSRFPNIKILECIYDGFGRCVREDRESNIRVTYRYDKFDRVTDKEFRPVADFAGHFFRWLTLKYANHTSDELIIEQYVNNRLLGSRTYDGVGRLIEQKRGGSEFSTTWTYADESQLPSSSRSPRGIVQLLQFDPQLRQINTVSVNDEVASQFSYDSVTGLLVNSNNIAGVTRSQEYDEFGRLSVDTQIGRHQSEYRSNYEYSLAGRLVSRSSPQDGVEYRSYDSAGRLESITAGSVNVSYAYDQYGRVKSYTTSEGGKDLKTEITYGAVNELEVMREVFVNGIGQYYIFTSYLGWRISQRETIDFTGGDLVSTSEQYVYDLSQRLSKYYCVGANHPVDKFGREINFQEFTFDALNNITRAVTGFVDGSKDVSERAFNGSDPCQLTAVTHSNPVSRAQLVYDESGNLISDGENQYLYDDFERLSYTLMGGAKFSAYTYDADGRQVARSDPDGRPDMEMNYAGEQVVNNVQMGRAKKFIRTNEGILVNKLDGSKSNFNLLDQTSSVRAVLNVGEVRVKKIMYTPYGVSNAGGEAGTSMLIERTRSAFNGELLDPVTNLYHLGNGRRAYSPELMIFLSPDPLSPFDAGGINAYAYCHGDPINFMDPSGLAPEPWTWALIFIGLLASILSLGFAAAAVAPTVTIGVVAGVVAGSLGVVSGTLGLAANSVQQADSNNGWDRGGVVSALNKASLGFGVGSIAFGLATAAGTAINHFSKVLFSKAPITFQNILPDGSTTTALHIWPRANSAIGKIPGAIADIPVATWEAAKVAGRGLVGYDGSYGFWARLLGVTGGSLDLAAGFVALGFGAKGVADEHSQNSANSTLENGGLSLSDQSSFTDSITSANSFSKRFDEGTNRIRASAIVDMYGRSS